MTLMTSVTDSLKQATGELARLPGFSYVCTLVGLFALVALVFYWRSNGNVRPPPTVTGHWYYKNCDVLSAPWRSILIAERYKPIYGDIIQLLEPSKTRVILNSLDVISKVLEKQGSVTSDRPRNVLLFEMTGVGDEIAFRNHDETHKNLRRLIASGLSPKAAQSYTDLYSSTASYFLRDVHARTGGDTMITSDTAAPEINADLVNPNDHSTALTASVQDSVGRFIIRMAFGHVATEGDPLLKKSGDITALVLMNFEQHFWVNDFPILKLIPAWFPGADFKRLAKTILDLRRQILAETFDLVFDKFCRGVAQLPSYTLNMIELNGGKGISEDDKRLIKFTSTAMSTAGTTTTTAVVRSFLFAMCIRPDIAAKVQSELDTQIGRDRIPTVGDREVLPYMDAVLQEVLRHYPILPLGLEHRAAEDIEVRGYEIRKGTIIEGNIWALMRDPALYPDPEKFDPERFLKSTPDTDPRRFVFGFGRRVCPGQYVAMNSVFVMCAAFMSTFNITASEETVKRVEDCKREPWRMMAPFGHLEPLPFGCTIKPRDAYAEAVLETCKDTAVIA